MKRILMSVVVTVLLTCSPLVANAQDSQETYDEISNEVSEIRELSLIDPIDVEVMSRTDLQQQQRDDLETEYPAEDRENDQRVLVAFGLIDEDLDLGDLYVNLLGEQVAGYYDPTSDEMVVVASSDGDELSAADQATFAHEVVHALQDQHFDLETFTDLRLEGTSDESLAITALIEGDATVGQLDFLIANPSLARDYLDEIQSGDSSSEVFDSAPAILSETLIFPYLHGQEFVQALYDNGGWDAVNEAFGNPPTTTEQILHPEKYQENEGAIAVDLPDLETTLGTGWTTIDTDTMGEFQISILLGESGLDDSQVEAASEGWGGDSYSVCATEDELVVAWASAWDSEDDAEEFAKALGVRESERLDADVEEEDGAITIEGADEVIQIVRDGSSVTYVQAPDRATLETVQDSLD
jgi:hypothetical protein